MRNKESQRSVITATETFHSGMLFLTLNASKAKCDLQGLLESQHVDQFTHYTS